MIIIFPSDSEYFKYMVENKGYIFENKFDNKLLNWINKVHNSIKINKIIKLPLKKIWYKHYLKNQNIKNDECNIFIFFEGNQIGYDVDYICYLKSLFPNSKFVFRYTNILYDLNLWTADLVNKYYDYVFTMDLKESENQGWLYYPNTYNLKLAEKKDSTEIKYDIFFIGRDKGRHEKLINLCMFLSERDVNCKFLISGVPQEKQINDIRGIEYIEKVNYEQVIDYILHSNCILEILQDNQYGSTLRPMEAIAYNKKFITNDTQIINQIYFEEKNMKVFRRIEELDIQFIKDKNKVNYKHRDAISSKHFFEIVQNTCK